MAAIAGVSDKLLGRELDSFWDRLEIRRERACPMLRPVSEDVSRYPLLRSGHWDKS